MHEKMRHASLLKRVINTFSISDGSGGGIKEFSALYNLPSSHYYRRQVGMWPFLRMNQATF